MKRLQYPILARICLPPAFIFLAVWSLLFPVSAMELEVKIAEVITDKWLEKPKRRSNNYVKGDNPVGG